jgi:uncharacterized protein involved in outer membrane biogenesis
MRRLLWIALLLAAIAAVVLGAAALSLNHIIAREHDHLLQQARAALGRDLAAGRISVRLWGGIGIRVDDLEVAEDPRFGAADFARAASVTVRARLLPLLWGRLELSRIDLTQPQIELIRNDAGDWNWASIGHAASRTKAQPGTSIPSTTGPSDPLPFVITRATITDGSMNIIDRSRQPEQTIPLAQVDLDVTDIGQDTPIRFSLDAALHKDRRNIHLRGVVGPWQQASGLPLRVDGNLGPIGPHALRLGDLHLDATLTPISLQVSHLTGRAFDGSFQLTGQYPLRHDGEAFLKGILSHMALAQVLQLTMRDAAQHFAGSGRLAVDLHAAGASAAAVRATLTGQVVADAQDAVLKDFNLVDETLRRLTDLPKIGQLVSRNVKPRYARLFSEPDTRFRTLHATFQIADQRLRTDDLAIEAADYSVRATGWFGFDREIDLAGTLAMSKAFSRDVVADVKAARYLLDEHQELAIPFRLRGRIGKARPKPDAAYVAARLSQAIAPGAVKDLIEKFLGTKPHQPAASTPGKAENALERRLRELLDR